MILKTSGAFGKTHIICLFVSNPSPFGYLPFSKGKISVAFPKCSLPNHRD